MQGTVRSVLEGSNSVWMKKKKTLFVKGGDMEIRTNKIEKVWTELPKSNKGKGGVLGRY